MNVGRKLILIVVTSVALVTIPAATGIYYYAKHRLIANEGATLVAETKSIAETNTKILHGYELSLKALANTLSKSLTAAPQASEEAEFDRLIQHSTDGAWRSKHKNTIGDMETGVFLPPDASLDTQQKILHLRVKHIFDAFGSSITSDTSNIWLATLNKSEVIYDNNYPNFIFDMSADTDYSQTPWVTLGDPATNPERRLLWTPPLYDVPSKLWMISAVQPIDVSGHWIGTVGRDIALRKKKLAIFKHSQRYADEQYFLIDAQGNYLEASLWQKELQSNPKNISKLLLKEPQLAKLFNSPLSTTPHVFEQEVSLQGKKYLVAGMTMPVVGWHYFRLVPVEGVLAPMQKLFFAMIGVVLASGLLIGLLIDIAVKRNIVNRLKLLAEAVRQYGLGQLGARANLTGDDEIAKTSREFDAMANQLESTLNAIPDILFELGLDGCYYAVHTPDETLLVAPPNELIGKKVSEMLPTHSAAVVMAALQEAQEKGWSRGKQYQRNTPRGMLWFELSVAKKSNANVENPRFLVLSRDITERKVAENDLRISAIAFEAQESMMVSDANKVILRVNKAFTEITGYHADEVIGYTSMPLRSNLHDASFYAEIWDSVNLNGSWKGELYSKRKNGEVYPGILSVTAVYDQNCVITHYVTSLVDITKEKITAEEIQFLAFYDPLTGLPNRRLLVDRLDRALSAKVRNGKDGALLFIDLDHFKTLNDSLGHDVGDLLLQQVAKRLTACVRDGDTVARLGGDEYVVLLENLSEHPIEAATQAEAISAKILATLNAPYQLDRHEYHSTSSIGAALFSGHGLSQEDLLKHADIAMYQAKKAGRNTLRFFDPQMQQAIHARVDLERELRKAIEKQQFQLYYQAQTNFKGNAIGAEALIRWIHPERGLVSPFEFIPLAEETGAILAIGEWVLETACAQLEIWQHVEPIRDITLSINVSARQFRQADFSTQVQAAVERHDINPMLLKLELTESILLEDFEGTIATINALKKIGVLVSLDDFGTGYSSLQYLKRLPLQQLKIDQSFVRDILTDSSDQAIVRTIIAMAKSLELEVIAEGVETEAQRQHLLEIGCQSFQGYLFGKPMPIKEFEATFPED